MGQAREPRVRSPYLRLGGLGAVAVLSVGIWTSAGAFQIKTGSEDLELRWDNTVKYNIGMRVEDQNGAILKNANADDGDRNFDRWSLITNRFDILSELDFVYKRGYGFRVSAAGWYDNAYENLDNDSVATSNRIRNGQQALGLSTVAEHQLKGPYGELLDAFVFGKVNLGPVPVNVKVGRHTVYWGESMITNQAISYSQAPIDAAKGAAVPGTELKELFRPLAQVSATAQLTDTLSLALQQFLEWEPYRLTESGGYFSASDMFMDGGESLVLVPGVFFLRHGEDQEPEGWKSRGVALRWSPGWLDGTLGFYYRRFTDMIPSQLILDIPRGRFHVTYADDIDLYGVSASRKVLGTTVGAEVSYRRNMPLAADPFVNAVNPALQLPDDGDILGPKGNTVHGVVNVLGLLKKSLLWDAGSWLTELNYTTYTKVTSDPNNLFTGRSGNHTLGAADKHAVALNVQFSPQWFQVLPGMDLTMPLFWGGGIRNTAAVPGGSAKDAGSYSAGLSLDIYQKYTVSAVYAGYYGRFKKDATGAATEVNSGNALLKDRDNITVTLKATF
ncbi:MAG: DUF1302 domain-containing protein [Deltaproteobacteria bacterium]|nr:DUF1302 domain-containing protein [Deltaproteobacteria bacterium]